jgi:hypothetical protein
MPAAAAATTTTTLHMKKKQHFCYLASLVQTLMLHIILILSYEIMHWVME